MAATQPMRLLVLGATGATGRAVVTQALALGHRVTAFARRPEAVPGNLPSERLVRGSLPEDREALSQALAGQDVVISALGRGLKLRAEGLMTRSVPILVESMERQGVRRLIFTSAFGVGDTWQDVPPLSRIFARLFLRDIYADKTRGEEILRRSALDWTLVYPTTLTNGAPTGHYRCGERLALRGLPTMSRADLAHFLLTQLSDRRFSRRGVLVTG